MKRLLALFLLMPLLAFGEGSETLKLGTQTHNVQSPLSINWTGTTLNFSGAAVSGLSGSAVTLKTNGTTNGSQTLLNLVAGTNITLTDNGSGSVTIASTGGGGGGVTSVDVSGSNGISSSGGPVTGSGTIALSLPFTLASGTTGKTLTVNNNITLAGTDGSTLNVAGGGTLGSAAFDSESALTKTDDTNVTLTLGGTPSTALLHAASITAGWTGTLAVSRGGTGAATSAAHKFFGNNTGSTAAPDFETIGSGDLPDLSATYVPTSRTLTIGPTTSDLSANRTFLGNVTNDAQTTAAIVPNTAPSAGQILVGNAGGTAYAPVTLSGSGATATLSSAGVLTLSAIPNATLSNSAITIAGTSTSLGGSITLDTISGVSSNGFLKRTGANTWTNDSSTYLTGNQTITLSGDATGSGATSIAVTNVNLPTGVTQAGYLAATAIAAPGTPASGLGRIYVDSTSKNLSVKDDAGVIKHGVQTKASTTSNFLTAISDAGVVSAAQPAYTDITGTPTIPTGANPSASVALTATNGSAATFMRSDGAPALDVSIAPTWTGLHNFTQTPGVTITNAQTSVSFDTLSLSHRSSGTPAANFGAAIVLGLDDTSGNVQTPGRLEWLWTTATHASHASAFDVQLVTGGAGTPSTVARFFGSGGFSVNSTTDPGAGIINANTGFEVGGAATSGNILVGDGTKFAAQALSGSGATATLSSSGVLTLSAIPNATLSNSAITIAGTSTSLGGSITLDTITGISTNGVVKRTGANTYAVGEVHNIGAVWSGGGSVLTTGRATGYVTVPYAGTITGYSISADAGTCTIQTWRKAAGTAVPTVSDSISTSGVQLSSGTHVRSSTTSDFTSTTVTAGDVFAFNLGTIATATEITFSVEITE